MNIHGIDKSVFPTLAKYLDNLPQGLDTFPAAKTRAFYSIELQKRLGQNLQGARLPFSIKSRLSETWKPDAWIPATIYAALCCVCLDTIWTTKETFHQGMYEIASLMYASMFFRAVMFIMSPSLMMLGSASRWNGFHLGTTLRASNQTKTSGDMVLNYPGHLFPEPCLHSLAATFDCAITSSGAKQFHYTLVVPSIDSAIICMRWVS